MDGGVWRAAVCKSDMAEQLSTQHAHRGRMLWIERLCLPEIHILKV